MNAIRFASPFSVVASLILALALSGCQAPQPTAYVEVPFQYKEAELLAYRYAHPKLHLSFWDFGCTRAEVMRLLVKEAETHHTVQLFRPKRESCRKTKVPMEAEFDLGLRLNRTARIQVKLSDAYPQ